MGQAIRITEYEKEQNNLEQSKLNGNKYANQNNYKWNNYSSSLQLKQNIDESPSKQINFSKWLKIIQYFIRQTYKYSPFISISDISIMIVEYINTMYFFLNWTLHNELSWNVRNSFKIIQINEKPFTKGVHCWRISV